jgi:hypothetical protein
MTDQTNHAALAPTEYLPTSDRAALLAEALTCIITGRPLPEAVRPAPFTMTAVGSVQEGIGRIVGGRSG